MRRLVGSLMVASVVIGAAGVITLIVRLENPPPLTEQALSEEEACDVAMIDLAVILARANGDPKSIGSDYSDHFWYRFLLSDYQMYQTDTKQYGPDVAAAKSVARVQDFCRSMIGGR